MNCVLTHFGIELESFAFMYLHSVCCRFTIMCSKLLCFCGTLVWQMCLKLVHHYAFDIDLITLPDVVVLIYLEPILAKEWKTFRAVWKHLFLKIPTFFFLK